MSPDVTVQALPCGKADEKPNESVKLLGGLRPSWPMSRDIDPKVSLSNHAKSSAEKRQRSDSHSGAQAAPGGFMSPDETVQALACGKADQQQNVSVNLGGLVPPWCSMRRGIDPSQTCRSDSSVRLHEIRFEKLALLWGLSQARKLFLGAKSPACCMR